MSPGKSKKLKLMVVDDEPDNLDLLYRTFRRDYKVFKADGALRALEVLEENGEMAIIISDQRMPVMNGTEFLSKTVDRFPNTIRILLTGYTDVEDLVGAINSGKVFKYITKPWNPETLKEVIQQASETYKVLKKRTDSLRHALRREELFNSIMTTIRESLDYEKLLQKIIQTVGDNFSATTGILKPVEDHQFLTSAFVYQAKSDLNLESLPDSQSLMDQVLADGNIHQSQEDLTEQNWTQVAVPLKDQQELLGVFCLSQIETVESWVEADIQLLETVAQQSAIAVSQARLYQQTQQQAEKMRAELEVARQIQHNLLRQSWPELDQAKVQASCLPAREVGGDFFEVYVHPQGDVWLALGDVSGKGVPAALFMASAISILRRELAQEEPPEPDVVIRNLNKSMSEDLFSTNCFITMVVARYTPGTHKLIYANAGHIYPMLWSHQKVVEQENIRESVELEDPNYLKTRGVPVGILPDWKAKAGELSLKTGDVFLLTSDGLTEATLTKEIPSISGENLEKPLIPGSMINQEGLWQLILKESYPFDLEHLLTHLGEYTNEVQEDDQTILFLEVL